VDGGGKEVREIKEIKEIKEIREVKEISFSKFTNLLKFSTTHPTTEFSVRRVPSATLPTYTHN
jgi:hypothetical protein